MKFQKRTYVLKFKIWANIKYQKEKFYKLLEKKLKLLMKL